MSNRASDSVQAFVNLATVAKPGTEAEILAKRRARDRLASELLLARLLNNHPDHAVVFLRHIEPRVVDLEPPSAPLPLEERSGNVIPLPVSAAQMHAVPKSTTILQAVCAFYEVALGDICSINKTPPIVHARQVAWYLMRNLTKMSKAEIGRKIGRRDHTTIGSGILKIEKMLNETPRVSDEIEVLKLKIHEITLNNIEAQKRTAAMH
jgi:hypothetical protein